MLKNNVRKVLLFLLAFVVISMSNSGVFQLKASAATLPTWALGPFTRPVSTPVISPNANLTFSDPMTGTTVKWAQGQTFNPASIVVGSTMNVLFRAEDGAGVGIGSYTSRVGRATSTNGINFTIQSTPVEYPKNDAWKKYDWKGGEEDPRVVQAENGTYYMYYTMYNRDNPVGEPVRPILGVSTSTDLVNWTKKGPVFKNYSSILNSSHKSASVVQKVVNGKQVAAMINGKYWMYWGEDAVRVATSTDLINWAPVMNGSSMLTIFSPRSGYFDSALTECGPPSILTNNGIVMIYNGKNSTDSSKASSLVGLGAYSCGQALFSASDPTVLLGRLPEPFFKPELAFEKSGQYPQGTTFAEGLSLFNGKWYLYYGTADTYVGVATAPVTNSTTYYKIKNFWTGKYLHIENNTGKVQCGDLGGDWASAKWKLEDMGNGNYRIQNKHTNQYMHIENNLGYVQYGTLGGDWGSAKWKLKNSTNGSIQFNNFWKTTQYIHIENNLGYAQSSVLGGDWGTSKWILEPTN